jgi:D-sedoheptulose 7-phosphate isomerase
MNEELIARTINESIAVKQAILADPDLLARIGKLANACIVALRAGNRILLAGNGGSAADAQHIAAELVSRYAFDRPGLPSIALSTDTSMLTAIGNDYGYDQIFRRQLEANGRQGDVFVGISTSGNSPNVIAALQRARELGITTAGLTGQNGAGMKPHCDHCLQVPSTSTPRIQESHIMIGHIICGIIEDTIFGALGNK